MRDEKIQVRVKSRMDQRTRAQLPLLPRCCGRWATAQGRRGPDQYRRDTQAGDVFSVAGQRFQRCRQGPSGRVYVTETSTGKRRNLTHEDEAAFWSWATVEILRATGIRVEEMLELAHHSFIAYELPTTGEIVPMLQVAPSKTDAERLLLVSPELAEVLTAIIFRVRAGNAALPLVSAYDVFEQTWSASMPFLFQRRYGSEDRPINRSYIRECMVATSGPRRSPSPASRWNGGPSRFRENLRDRCPAVRDAAAHRRENLRARPAGHHHGLCRDLPRRHGLLHHRASRPPPGRAAQRRYTVISPAGEWDDFLAHFELPESRARRLWP